MSSRRPSSTSQPPPNPPVFFTDRDLGNDVADALERAGHTVLRHDKIFPDTRTRDEVWLRRVGDQGWLGVTHNKKIQRTKLQRDAAMAAGATVFFLIGKLTHARLAANFILTLPKVIEFWHAHSAPFTAKVYRPDLTEDFGEKPGRVELWMDKAGWLERLRIEAQRQGRR